MVAYSFPNIDATKPDTLGRDKIEDAIADFTNNEARKNMQWINYISVIAQASPMLGLTGTVIGMVNAFGTLRTTGAADPSQLAGDISVALLTTLWGLINAIPCIICYFILKNKYNGLVADSIHIAEELINSAVATVNADTLYAKIPEGIDVWSGAGAADAAHEARRRMFPRPTETTPWHPQNSEEPPPARKTRRRSICRR